MAISKLLHLLSGLVQSVNMAAEELQVLSITVGGVSGTNLTKTQLDTLISNTHASGSDNQNVTAGDGLTGGGSGATPTLAVGAGNGISVSADAVAVNYDNVSIGLDGSSKLATKGSWKEAVPASGSLVDGSGTSAGIRPGSVFYFAAQPAVGDTVTFTVDADSSQRTYTFVANQGAESLATDVSIESDAATAMARLATRVMADGSRVVIAVAATYFGSINSTVIAVLLNTGTAIPVTGSCGVYGTWGTQASCQVVNYANGSADAGTVGNLPTTYVNNFSLGRRASSLLAGEAHVILGTDQIGFWDKDGAAWKRLTQPSAGDGISIDTTVGSSTLGKISVVAETNKGIAVGSSGVSVDYDDSSIGIDGTSHKLEIKDSGVVDAHISASADIAVSKLADSGSAGQFLLTDADKHPSYQSLSGDVTVSSAGVASIAANAVGGAEVRLENNTYLRARNAADSGDVNVLRVNASDKPEFLTMPQCSGIPSAASDLTNKSYVDQVVITGAHLKEAVLLSSQLSDAQGILAAEVIYFAGAPIEDDTVIIKNGTNTYTYTFKDSPSGNYQVQTNASAATSMSNLASKIHGNLATDDYDATFMADGLDAINSAGVVVVFEKASASGASTSRIYGVWATQSDAKVVAFDGDTEYSTKAGASMASSDPAAVKFGFRKQASALSPGEFHASLGDSIVKGWNGDSNAWFTLNGSGSLPDATSASGGGTKGKVTFDSDKGLSVGSGIAEVKIDNSSIGFGVDGDIGKLLIKASGVTNAMLAGSIADSKLSQITTASKVAGSAVQLQANKGIEDSTGLGLKLDGSTLSVGGDGLKVNSIANAQIASDAAIAISKLAAIGDGKIIVGAETTGAPTAVSMSGDVTISNAGATTIGSGKVTNDMLAGSIADSKLSTISTGNKVSGSAVQLKSTGALEDSTGLSVKVDASTIDKNGSNQLYVKSVGQLVSDVYVTLTNNTGSALAAGAVVILSQSTAGEILLADSDAIATCEGVVGVVKAEIANAASGKVQVAGEATVLNGSVSFDLGKRVYVSGTAGQGTKTAPSAANSVVFLLGNASATDKVILNMQLVGVNV